MFSWVTSWWRTNSEQGAVIAPARNAPNDGRDIKTFLNNEIARRHAQESTSTSAPKSVEDSKPPANIIIVTCNDIQQIRQRLRKIPDDYERAKPQVPPLFGEINDIFSEGREAAFRKLREKREARKKRLLVNSIENNPEVTQEASQFSRL